MDQMNNEIKIGDNVMIIGGYAPLRGVIGAVEDILEDDKSVLYKVIVSDYAKYSSWSYFL